MARAHAMCRWIRWAVGCWWRTMTAEASRRLKFRSDHKTRKLTLLNQVSTHGAGPCYVSLDSMGRWVLVANYDGGSVATFEVQIGSQNAKADVIESGLHAWRGPMLCVVGFDGPLGAGGEL